MTVEDLVGSGCERPLAAFVYRLLLILDVIVRVLVETHRDVRLHDSLVLGEEASVISLGS